MSLGADDLEAAPTVADWREAGQFVGTLVHLVFAQANRQGLDYAVVRNYENLPHAPGRDIDVLVRGTDAARFAQTVYVAALNCGFRVICDKARSSVRSISVCLIRGSEIHALTIDIIEQLFWRLLPIVEPDQVLASARTGAHGIRQVAPGVDAALRLTKVVLHRERLDSYKAARIIDYYRNDSSRFVETLGFFFSPADIEFLRRELDGGRLADLAENFRGGRMQMTARGLLHNPRLLGQWFAWITWSVVGSRAALGKNVVFIGPDGSGKSTMVQRLSQLFADHAYRRVLVRHGGLALFPRLRDVAKIMGIKPAPRQDFTAKHSGSEVAPHSLRRLLFYFSYYGFEGFVGKFVVAWRRRRGQIVMFDRYVYDFYVQPAYRLAPTPLLDMLRRLWPRPDIVFLLLADPQAVYRRKPELQPADIAAQQDGIRELASRLSGRIRVIELDTSDWTIGALDHAVEVIAEGMTPPSLARHRSIVLPAPS